MIDNLGNIADSFIIIAVGIFAAFIWPSILKRYLGKGEVASPISVQYNLFRYFGLMLILIGVILLFVGQN